MVSSLTREWGTLVDRKDKLQNIHNPEHEYAIAAQNALGRKMDSVIIQAGLGTARTGEDGSGSTALGNAQKVTAVASGAIDYMNVQALRKAKRIMDAAEVVGRRCLVHSADFLEVLLSKTEVTSSDYNTVKALVQGEIDTFLGFHFIHSELMAPELATTYDTATYKFDTTTGLYSSSGTALVGTELSALAFAEGAIILGKNPNALARIEERADKSYSMQVYASMDFGAVRMEEAAVVEIIYKA